MREVTIKRCQSHDWGTAGFLKEGDFECRTLELQWEDNKRRKSCIPVGTYMCKIVDSPKFGKVYGILDVPGRFNVLIHVGNFAGDTDKGLKSDVLGCVLLGNSITVINTQMGVSDSGNTFKGFMKHMGNEDFMLHIENILS